MNKLMAMTRVVPPNSMMVPFIKLIGGGKFGPGGTEISSWMVAVPFAELRAVRAAVAADEVPLANAAICCLTPKGESEYFEVSMRNFGGWGAPNLFEELEASFALPESTPLVGLDGKNVRLDHSVKGVIFIDEAGVPLRSADSAPVELRYNLTNFKKGGGTYSEDGRVWKISVNGTEYTGHLAFVATDNRQRIFGVVAYVKVTKTPPEKVVYCEAIAVLPQLLVKALANA